MSKQKQTTMEVANVFEDPTVLVEVPVVDYDPTGHYATRHISVNLQPDEAFAIEMIRLGLVARLERLPGGRLVSTPGDVIRWVALQVQSAA